MTDPVKRDPMVWPFFETISDDAYDYVAALKATSKKGSTMSTTKEAIVNGITDARKAGVDHDDAAEIAEYVMNCLADADRQATEASSRSERDG